MSLLWPDFSFSRRTKLGSFEGSSDIRSSPPDRQIVTHFLPSPPRYVRSSNKKKTSAYGALRLAWARLPQAAGTQVVGGLLSISRGD